MIKKNQYVKIFFKNGLQIEGFVEEWTIAQCVLLSTDKQSKFIILDSKNDILGIKFSVEEKLPPEVELPKLQKEFKEVVESPTSDLRLKSLVELKQLMNEQEKKIISEKVKSHTATGGISRLNKYELPSFIKK